MSLKKVQLCDVCRYEGGFHYPEDGGEPFRCPNIAIAKQHEDALRLTAEANAHAFDAAKKLITDAAERLEVLSANDIRPELDAAQIPGQVVGTAFLALSKTVPPVLSRLDERVPSNEDSTHSHGIYRWRSLVFKGQAA